ncbi:Wadjet anti-phage system protein JetD domain-containing protein [Xylanimonas sp. McL0601]|uniref:Wadjet anti-phage system protein JetD domain-containing protein n=1 Tax=Xylanimonas sp. McL0601 TaxID=3414739 RepID=UPI003CF2988E
MVTPDAARAAVAKVYQRRFAECATAGTSGGGLLVDLPLHPPTETAALRSPGTVAEWIASWRALDPGAGGSGVVWDARRWASMGTQTVPARLQLGGPEQVARFVRSLGHWRTASSRAVRLREALPASDAVAAAVQRTLRAVVELAPDDVERLVGVLRWLLENPRSGLFVRQLPIRGVDTKWIEQHRPTVSALFTAATGAEDLGLATRPALVRVRFLDEALSPGRITDLSAAVDELAKLPVAPARVVVVENLESLLSLPELDGVVAVHGQGYAVRVLDQIPWVRAADVVYWGDLDTDGFNILSIARDKVPQTRSVLMNRAAVTAHLDLAVPDPKPRRTFAGPLTDVELDALEALHDAGDVRIEQERIPWGTAMSALRKELVRRTSSTRVRA